MSSTSIQHAQNLNFQNQKKALDSLQNDPTKVLQNLLPEDIFNANPAIKNSQPLIFPDHLRTPLFKGVGLAAKNANLVTSGQGAAAPVAQFDHTTWDKAIAHAAKTGKPLVVKVGASWCSPCQEMKRNVMSNPELKKLLENQATFVDIEIERSGDNARAKALAKKISADLDVEIYPTVYILTLSNRNGKPLPRIIKKANNLNVEQFQAFLYARNNGLKTAAELIKDAGFGTNPDGTKP